MRVRDLPPHLQARARAALEATTPRPQPAVALPDPAPRQPLVLALEEPPALNVMLDLAKERRRGRSVVYAEAKRAYETRVVAAVREQGYPPPAVPWARWRLTRAAFRLHQLRDPLELLAGLKWPIDALVAGGWLADDSPRHLRGIPDPEQVIDRDRRGVTVIITPEDDCAC
jgi:hypothetical protein